MDESEFLDVIKNEISKLPSISKSYLFFYDQAMGFYHAISWSEEKWLQALLATHVLTFLFILLGRRFYTLQVLVFLVMCGLVFMAERLNEIGRERWQEFSTQNYFDTHGVFMGVVFAAPMLLNLTLQLFITLGEASRLVIQVKRHELGIDKKQKKQAEKKDQ